ncbi:ATP-binding cassette domain-containing protein [Paenibacillus farraposensis]|uniref:ATP-binding cassette domain-containing protein n=1 Tax=Paenibacillus farraposensis TaxID=2807095 RepID=A0ABW4DND8_9BACL
MATIELNDVNMIYGTGSAQVQVLHEVGFAADAGSLNLIVGPSNSGKSTFLTIAGGLLTPTSGTVLIDGTPYQARSAKQRGACGHFFGPPFC